MKVFASIHNVDHLDNRSKVTFNIGGNHNDYVELFNKVVAIERKHNAQSTIYSNKSSLVFDKNANLIGLTDGNSGGTVTFHSHSCSAKEAAIELIELLESVK
jgi:hypothetical protein